MIGLQQQTFQSMASTIKQGFSLPKPDIAKFDGNPLDYWNFVRSFENGISRNASDDSERLSYLLQYCTGAAREAIKSCLALDSGVGYQTATALLKERFGHPFKIASAHLNRITRGPPLRPYDQRGLLAFADQLRDCQNVLESIGYLNEINSADNLRSVVDRLPFHLRVKWLEVADRLRESGLCPRIHHISEFVSQKARAVNDPIFGDIANSDREKSRKISKPSGPQKGTSFSSQGGSVKIVPSSGSATNQGGVRNVSGKCLVCDGLHQLWNCEQFKRKPYADRIKALREHRLCDNCFKVGHTARGCLQRSACYVEGCNAKHMTVIHPPEHLRLNHSRYANGFRGGDIPSCSARDRATGNNATGSCSSAAGDRFSEGHVIGRDVNSSGNHCTQSHAIGAGTYDGRDPNRASTRKVCLRIVPIRVHDDKSGQTLETYALLDNGSDVSLCDAELAKELGLQGEQHDFLLTTQEKKDSPKSGLELKLTVSSLDGTSTLEIPRVWTVDCLNVLSRSIPTAQDIQGWSYLSDTTTLLVVA